MWLNEFLVLRIRGNSCVLKQLAVELTVEKLGMKMNPSFNISSLLLVFSNLTITSLSVAFFTFILLGVHWASWICGFVVFVKFGNFSEIFFIHPPLSFSKSNHMCVPKLLILDSFFFFFKFFSLWFYFVFISTPPFFPFTDHFLCSTKYVINTIQCVFIGNILLFLEV